jgi:hypothetical protein
MLGFTAIILQHGVLMLPSLVEKTINTVEQR